MKALLTIEQLSEYIHKSIASVRSDAVRNPNSLPPICRLPGTKRLLWRIEDVERWVAQHVQGVSREVTTPLIESPTHVIDSVTKRRPGRPTKAEQIARQQQ